MPPPNLSSASCDLDIWPRDLQSRSFHAFTQRTDHAKLHQKHWCSEYCVHKFGDGRDGQTNEQVEDVHIVSAC